MQQEQSVSRKEGLNVDLLAWRVTNAKKRKAEVRRDREYNQRPRLRSETHH